jgi:hypothetical protein
MSLACINLKVTSSKLLQPDDAPMSAFCIGRDSVVHLSGRLLGGADKCEAEPHITRGRGKDWVVNKSLLNSMYALKSAPPSQLQDTETCQHFSTLIDQFFEASTDIHHIAANAAEHDGLKIARDVAGGRCNDIEVEYFPAYAAAVLRQRSTLTTGQCTPGFQCSVVGLDNWQSSLHRSTRQASKVSHTAVCRGFKEPHVSLFVKHSDLCLFKRLFSTIFAKSTQRCGDQRSAAGGSQGHQRTPSFIAAILKDVENALLECSDEDEVDAFVKGMTHSQPQGGFTDVGRHTGGLPRDAGLWSRLFSRPL